MRPCNEVPFGVYFLGKESENVMNAIFDYLAGYSDWIVPFAPFLLVIIYLAIESRWDAYSRRSNYRELRILNELRRDGVITQDEFDVKKEELLGV